VTPPPDVQGDREAGLLAEREPIVVWGNQATTPRGVYVGETSDDKTEGSALCMPVDNYKGACGLERCARFSRGENSEGRSPGSVAALNQAVELVLARKPLRG
jgi:hypothetical protein